MAVLSGPTFAREVGAGLPTAMVVASTDAAFAMRVAEDLASPGFRTYVDRHHRRRDRRRGEERDRRGRRPVRRPRASAPTCASR
jgi:hypothetical protein